MTTKLESEVTRETRLTVDEREVEVTLVPMDVATCSPEAIRIHLKGLRSGDKIVPLHLLLRALGLQAKLPQEIRPQVKTREKENAELEALICDLERLFGRKPESINGRPV